VKLPSLAARFIGMANFDRLFADPLFFLSVKNSVLWILVTVPCQFLLGLATALLLNSKIRWKLFFSTAAIVPWAVSPVAAAMVWSWLYHPDVGLFNVTLNSIGLSFLATRWLSNPNTALFATMVPYIWSLTPVATFVLLGALQSISESLYEAAKVDGASRLEIFWYIVLPHLRPMMVTLILLLVFFSIGSSISFVYPMTGGGPANSTMVADLYIYNATSKRLEFELGAAASGLMFVFVVAIAVVYVLLQRGPRGSKADAKVSA
jgi:multiple sugar transport system permease protein